MKRWFRRTWRRLNRPIERPTPAKPIGRTPTTVPRGAIEEPSPPPPPAAPRPRVKPRREEPPPLALVELVADDPREIGQGEVVAIADRMGVEPDVLWAVLDVEAPFGGFDVDTRRPIILYEPHVFSRETDGEWDDESDIISYPRWRTQPYPGRQAARWVQLERAYALEPEAALRSVSWGRPQMMGFNCSECGFGDDVYAFVRKLARSERDQLEVMEAYLERRRITTPLRALDWYGVAAKYNGPGAAEEYAGLLQEAYMKRQARG